MDYGLWILDYGLWQFESVPIQVKQKSHKRPLSIDELFLIGEEAPGPWKPPVKKHARQSVKAHDPPLSMCVLEMVCCTMYSWKGMHIWRIAVNF